MDRVLQVIGGMSRAGAETMLMNAYRAIDKNIIQFDFLVYSQEEQDYEKEIISLGGRVLRIHPRTTLDYVRQIRRILHDYGPYIAVHAHTLHNSAFAMLAARIECNALRITHSHNTQNRVQNSLIGILYDVVTKQIIRTESQIWLACGEEAGQYLFGSAFKDKGVVINNGVDLSQYDHRNRECDVMVSEYQLQNKLVIGSVARFDRVKNHEFMIKIAEALQRNKVDFKMLLIGDGVLKNTIEDAVKKAGLQDRVLLLGLRSDIPDLLRVMNVFLMPSLFEGNPVTLIEAQASGLPAVISDVITDKIDLGLGLIHRCSLNEDIDLWCEAVVDASKTREFDSERIKWAFIEKKYSSESTAEQLMNIYLNR